MPVGQTRLFGHQWFRILNYVIIHQMLLKKRLGSFEKSSNEESLI